MSIRVGIDLVSVAEVRESIAVHGERYLRRVFTDGELADCTRAGAVDEARLAACFAGKEAALKVLRASDEPVPWCEVEIRRDPGGCASLLLAGSAARLARRAGITELRLSLGARRGLASAMVIADTDTDAR